MTRRVVALFACSAMSVSASLPAFAQDAQGVVEMVDCDTASLKLTDGTDYRLPAGFDCGAVRPGMRIHMLYEPAE